jgi:hypothetical protein
MKNLLLLLALSIGLGYGSYAQVCLPDSSHFTAGVFVYPASLPCITQGSSFGSNINIRIPDSIDAHYFDTTLAPNTYYLYVDSVQVDSVTGAPVGIAVATNPTDTQWLYANQYGCFQFLGTTTAAAGTYPLSVYGNGCVHGNINGNPIQTCYAGLLPSYFSYSLSVCAPVVSSGVCTPDSAAFTHGVYIYPATLPCITPGASYSGTVSLLVPDSVDAANFYAGLPAGQYYVHIDSIRLDSVTGAPAGITVSTNPGDTTWLHGGQYGCAVFSGTTTVTPGNFPIGMYARACIHGTFPVIGVLDTCVDHNLGAFFNFSLNVCNGPACTVDTTTFSSGVYVSPQSLPCIITGEPYSGQVSIQVPAKLDVSDFVSQVTLPPGIGFVYIDSIDITSISGYPAGITSISNPFLGTWLYPSTYACAVFSGTVNGAITPAGNYPLTITGTGCGHIVYNGQSYSQCMTNYNFSNIFSFGLSVCYPAGISQLSDGIGLVIFPNPNQGNFTVTVSSSARISGTMSVLDQLGRSLHTQAIDVTGTSQIPLELDGISPGAYLLLISTAEGRSVKQFIVK